MQIAPDFVGIIGDRDHFIKLFEHVKFLILNHNSVCLNPIGYPVVPTLIFDTTKANFAMLQHVGFVL